MIKGVGIDIVERARLCHALDSDGFKQRVYTPAEIEMGDTKKRLASVSFWAGRWAAKEALSKALGTGIGAQCSFQDIEVLSNEAGAPQMTVSGAAKKRMEEMGARKIMLSISHERSYAVAMVILEGE